jgi:carboxymethylenebutenolidase
MHSVDIDVRGLQPKSRFGRRDFMMTSLMTGFTLAVNPVNAQTIITTEAAGLTAGEVKISVADGTLPGYAAQPATGGPFPVTLVVQEIFGVHEHIKDMCRRFAKLGYLAVAPELYARTDDMSKVTDLDGARAAAGKAPDKQVMSDLDSTVAWAKANKGDTARLGITGWCWGGRIVWLYAEHNPDLKAAVAWYGPLSGQTNELRPHHPLELVKELKAPVLGLYGGQDPSIPVADVDKMREACKAAGKSCELVVYPDAPHAFNADYRPSYRAEAAKDGWQRLQNWFKQHGVA